MLRMQDPTYKGCWYSDVMLFWDEAEFQIHETVDDETGWLMDWRVAIQKGLMFQHEKEQVRWIVKTKGLLRKVYRTWDSQRKELARVKRENRKLKRMLAERVLSTIPELEKKEASVSS